MASPPFSLTITSPANTDIAANFPTLDRSDKDVIQSWLLILHNNQGRLLQGNMDQVGTANGLGGAPTPAANTGTIWYDSTGVWLEQRASLGVTTQIGVPVGGIIPWPTATAPNGWALCQGQSLSTSSPNALLFAVIGYTYGGSGANFNVPDLRGRGIQGVDAGAGRMASNNTLAASGGSETITLTQAMLPNITWTVSITDNGHNHQTYEPSVNMNITGGGGGFGRQPNNFQSSGGNNFTTSTVTTGITATVASGGSATAFNNLGPYLALNWIIRVF